VYRDYAVRMAKAETPAERREIVEEMCRMFAFSRAKAYKALKGAGWESGRKRRADAGSTSIGEEQLKLLAAMRSQSARKNGKVTMPVPVIRSVLQSQGVGISLRDSRLRELLRDRNLAAGAKTRTPHQRMRSEYPNQVHLTDPSVSLMWFPPGGKLKIIGDDQHYKNKDFFKDKPRCWRYVLTDHFSGSVCVRYYSAAGETALNMYDFLLYAWGKKDDPLYAFHGLPELLIWDCGSANISRQVTNALKALRIKTVPHLPGNPRAKGQVEDANNLVETQFESRLRFEPVNGMDELNEAVERWCAAYNANMIEYLDTRLKRGGMRNSRLMLWQKIQNEQLRELPDSEICRQIYTTGYSTRKVGGDLSISLVHPSVRRSLRYSLSHLPGILVGQEVMIQPILVDPEPLVQVSYKHNGELLCFEARPIVYNEAGFDVEAPVFGREYKRLPDTIREQNARELAAMAGDTMGAAHSFINAESPFIRQRTGEQIAIARPERVEVQELYVSHFEALRRVSSRLGFTPEGLLNRMKTEYPEGVPTSFIEVAVNEYEAGTDSIGLAL